LKKNILLLSIFIIFISLIGCKSERLNYTLVFSKEKSINNYAKIYQFEDGSKIYSEFSNIYFRKNENEMINLSSALEQSLITIDDIISKMNYEGGYNDGGSQLYATKKNNRLSNTDFMLIKCHTLDGNRNVIIGTTPDINKKCLE